MAPGLPVGFSLNTESNTPLYLRLNGGKTLVISKPKPSEKIPITEGLSGSKTGRKPLLQSGKFQVHSKFIPDLAIVQAT